jgi:hypothetical protein
MGVFTPQKYPQAISHSAFSLKAVIKVKASPQSWPWLLLSTAQKRKISPNWHKTAFGLPYADIKPIQRLKNSLSKAINLFGRDEGKYACLMSIAR